MSIEQALDKELQEAQEIISRTHIFFKKPFKIMYFAREDKKPLASNDPELRKKVYREDNEAGKPVNVLLEMGEIKEASDMAALKKRGDTGEIKFHPSLEFQLLMELFEQGGLTNTVVDPKPETATAAA